MASRKGNPISGKRYEQYNYSVTSEGRERGSEIILYRLLGFDAWLSLLHRVLERIKHEDKEQEDFRNTYFVKLWERSQSMQIFMCYFNLSKKPKKKKTHLDRVTHAVHENWLVACVPNVGIISLWWQGGRLHISPTA